MRNPSTNDLIAQLEQAGYQVRKPALWLFPENQWV
jgi:protein associated with RNAse G/E